MQNNNFEDEIEKNKNNIFMSEDLKGIILLPDSNIHKVCMINLNNSSIEGSVLSFRESKRKIEVVIQTDQKNLTCEKLESFLSIDVTPSRKIILKDKEFTYKEYLNQNGSYNFKFKLKLESDSKDGIWVW